MTFSFKSFAKAGVILALSALPLQAADEEASQGAAKMPTMKTAFEGWSAQSFTFEALVSNQRRSRPEFTFHIDKDRYYVLFDAGRKKRNAILDCLDLADSCEVKGTAFMLFEQGKMKMNVTDVTWLAIPAVDFEARASRLHHCFRRISNKRKKFSAVVEAKLSIHDLERKQDFSLEPVKPREISRGFEMLEDAMHNCSRSRMRLPVGDYRVKVYTQSGDVFLDYWED